MNEEKCTACEMPLGEQTKCACEPMLCVHCCKCAADCQCQCQVKKAAV